MNDTQRVYVVTGAQLDALVAAAQADGNEADADTVPPDADLRTAYRAGRIDGAARLDWRLREAATIIDIDEPRDE